MLYLCFDNSNLIGLLSIRYDLPESLTKKYVDIGYGENNIIENQPDYDYIAEDDIIFAEYDIGWFCMEKSSGKYCELGKPSAQKLQTFDTLEAMLKKVLLLSVEL